MKRHLLLLSGIIVVAAFLRLYRIDSLPPGASYDASFYGLDALNILQGDRPVFVPTNSGREALFSYVVALFFLWLGPGNPALYLSSAVIGILTIPAVYFMAREMLADQGGRLAAWAPAGAALAVAVSYWHVQLSRQGLRAIFVPFFVALTLALLWRGVRCDSRLWLGAAGVSLGLSVYTYQAIRLLPLLVVLGFAVLIWSRGESPLARWRELAFLLGLALVVALPLGVYAVTHPAEFNYRVNNALVLNDPVSLETGEVVTLQEQALDALLMYGVRGDISPIMNIPGHPALDPFLFGALLLGLLISLARARKVPYGYLIVWLVLMTLPAMLAGNGASEKRASGALPAVAVLIALGLLVPWEMLSRRAAAGAWPRAVAGVWVGLALLGLGASTARTYHDYFNVFGGDPELFTHFEAGQSAVGRYVAEVPVDEKIYLSPVPSDHTGLRMNARGRDDMRTYNGRECLVAPTHTNQATTYVIVSNEDKTSLDALERLFPQGRVVREGPLHLNVPYYRAFQVPPGVTADIRPAHLRQANWAGQIELLGYDTDKPEYGEGDKLKLALYFRALAAMDTDYTVFVHLLGPPNPQSGTPLWAQDDSQPCRTFAPTSGWEPGEILRDNYTLRIPKEAPTAEYQIAVGFYQVETGARLPVVDATGKMVGDSVMLGKIKIEND